MNETMRWPKAPNARQRAEMVEAGISIPETEPDPADIPPEVVPLKKQLRAAQERAAELESENLKLESERNDAIAKIGTKVRASPAAAELAETEKIVIGEVKGTGSDGLVTVGDVKIHIAKRAR